MCEFNKRPNRPPAKVIVQYLSLYFEIKFESSLDDDSNRKKRGFGGGDLGEHPPPRGRKAPLPLAASRRNIRQ